MTISVCSGAMLAFYVYRMWVDGSSRGPTSDGSGNWVFHAGLSFASNPLGILKDAIIFVSLSFLRRCLENGILGGDLHNIDRIVANHFPCPTGLQAMRHKDHLPSSCCFAYSRLEYLDVRIKGFYLRLSFKLVEFAENGRYDK